MAAKVNKKVVVLLIAGVACSVVGVMVAMNVVFKSGAELAAQGDRLLAAKDYEGAALAFSKAVNKDQNNVEYFRKWGEALQAQNPVSIQAYTDRYRQLLGTQRQIANILRVDPAAHRTVLDLVLREARLSPRSGTAWQSIEADSSDIITRMRNEPQDKIDQIRRYRGIATVGKMSQSLEVSTDDRKRAKEDLLAAMKQNPDDSLAAVYYADLMRLWAEKLRQSNNAEESAVTLAEGLAVMDDFCKKHPTSTVARLGLVQLQIAEARATINDGEQLNAAMKPKLEGLMATLEAEDPKSIDEFVATQVLDTAVASKLDNAVTRGLAVFDKLVTSRDGEPFVLLMRARFRAATNSPREAVNEFKAIMDLPNLPVSPRGIALFGVRDMAAIQRVDALIGMTEKAKTPEERAAALAETKQARDDLKARSTIDAAPKMLIDAKIALLGNEGADARRLLDQYHKATSFTDVSALFISAQLLRQQGLKGESRTMLQKIVDMRRATPEVFKLLAMLDYEMRNLPSAMAWVDQGLLMAPADQVLVDMKRTLEDAINGTAASPMQRALTETSNAMLQTPPDIEKIRAKGNEALSYCTEAKEYAQVAQMLVRVSRKDALTAVLRGLQKFPEDKTLLQMKAAFEVEDPVTAELDRIKNDTTLAPIDRAVRLYIVYAQVGRNADAEKALDEAAKIDAEHPVVVAGLFERALLERADGKITPAALEKARALARIAKDKNLDKVEGRIYAARLLEAEGKISEALPLLERATELDGLNPLTWRYLANAFITAGDLPKALQAITRSLQIKPDDVSAIVTRVRVLASMDRSNEALAAAKDAARLGISDPTFVQLWLLLEFRNGDKDLALERRAWIHQNQPGNMENSLEYARCLLQMRRLDEARTVLDAVTAELAKEGANQSAQQPLGMLRSALRGAEGDVTASLAEFTKLVESVPEPRREGLCIDFAELVKTLGGTELVVKVLDLGRQYQDAKYARVDRLLGDMYFGMADWDKAYAAYERARNTVPEDEDKLLLKRGIECLMKSKKFDESRKLIDAEGGDKSRDVQILLLASQLEFARGDRPKGLALLDKAVEAAPDRALPYRQRAIERMGDPKTLDDAIVDLEQASGIEPHNEDLTVLLTRAYTRKGDPARAVTTLEKALNNKPGSALLRNEHIQQLMSGQRFKDAIDSCVAASKADPLNTRWLMLKGIIYQRTNDQAAAVQAFEEAWKLNKAPDTAKALADALMAVYDASNPKSAFSLDRAKEVIEDPGSGLDKEPMVRMSRATLALRQSRRGDAVNDLRLIVDDKKLNLTQTQAGVFFIDELRRAFGGDMKKVQEMLDELRPADASKPQESPWPDGFRVTLARARLSVPEMKASAMDDLERLIKSPDKAAAIGAASTLGANAYLVPDIDRSIRALQAGLALDGDNVELNNNLAYVLSAGAKRHADALPFALKAAEKDPNNPNILDTLGVIYMNLDQLEKSEEVLYRARSIATDGLTRTMPTIHLIQVKMKKKLRSEADALYRELEELSKTEPRVKANYSRDIEEITKTMQANP